MNASILIFYRSRCFLLMASLMGMFAGYFSTTELIGRKEKGIASLHNMSISRPVYSGPNQSDNDTIEAYRRNPKMAQSRTEMLNALANWLATDPLECLNNGNGALIDFNYRGILGDSEAALGAASKIEDVRIRNMVILSAFRDLVSRDAMKALGFARMLPPSSRYLESLDLGKALGKDAGSEQMLAVLRHENCTANMFTQAMRAWAKEHTDEALKFLDQLDITKIPEHRVDRRAIWSALKDVGDPEVKLRHIENMRPSRDRDDYMTAVQGSILALDPKKWDSMFQTEDSRIRTGKIATDAAVKTVMTSPKDAALFLSKIPNVDEKIAAAARVTANLVSDSRKDPATIASWLKASTDPAIIEAIVKELRFQKAPVPEGY